MVSYRGKKLTQTAGKSGGKNNSAVDGFYIDESGTETNGLEYFIKKPGDKKELFTELFAGLLLKEFMARNLIAPHYFSSLICADLIQFDDGSYGLIQPKVAFTELFKIIGTGYSDGSDRDPFVEMISGPSYYPTLTQQGQYFGLSTSLMFSLLLGDHSVHSGNVVVFPTTIDAKEVKQFGRIDWGAAFRHFAHPENNTDDILNFYQYQGFFNFKSYYQGFFGNYKNIAGLFSAIADKSRSLAQEMFINKVSMEEIVRSAINKIPADLLDPETQAKLAEYMAIPSFATAKFGSEANVKSIIESFSSVLSTRLTKISALTENKEAKNARYAEVNPSGSSMYQSVLFAEPLPIKVAIDPFIALPEQFDLLLELISGKQKLDFSEINLETLAKKFNHYVELLAHQAEVFNLWGHEPESKTNIFAKFGDLGEPTAILGNAFIAQYRESTILRRLFTIDPSTLGTSRFAPYEKATHRYGQEIENTNSSWKKIETSLTAGYAVIDSLRQIQKTQTSLDTDLNNPVIIAESLENLRGVLASFTTSKQSLDERFQQSSLFDRKLPAFESPFFYPFSEEDLLAMNAEQLVTICLEELFSVNPGPLISRLIKNNTLWGRIENGYSKEKFGPRADYPQNKFERLLEWRSSFLEFTTQEKNFSLATNLDDLEMQLIGLQKRFDNLPLFLKADTETLQRLYEAKALLQEWQLSDQSYRSKEQAFLSSKSTATHADLQNAFQALPGDLQRQYEDQLKNHQKEMSYLQKREAHKKQEHFSAAQVTFSTLSQAYEELPFEIKVSSEEDFKQMQKTMNDWQAHQIFLEHQRNYLAAGVNEKSDIHLILIADYQKLTLDLQAQYQNVMTENSNELGFLAALKVYEQQLTITSAREVFPELKKAFDKLTEAQKATYQIAWQDLAVKNVDYAKLLRNRILQGSSEVKATDTTLARIQTGREDAEQLYQAIITDKRLWNAIANCKKEKLTAEVVFDLLAIQQFHQQRAVPENDYEYGLEYNQSLNRFYEKSLLIRLSDMTIKKQAAKIAQAAHEEFIPRHKTERYIADALMLISVLFAGLGLVIMVGRHLSNKTVFFSSMVTDRESDLKNQWIRQDLPDRTGSDDACLFNIPLVATNA